MVVQGGLCKAGGNEAEKVGVWVVPLPAILATDIINLIILTEVKFQFTEIHQPPKGCDTFILKIVL